MLALHQQRLDPQHGMRGLLTLQLPVLWIQTLLFPSVGDIESESSIFTHCAQDVATGGKRSTDQVFARQKQFACLDLHG